MELSSTYLLSSIVGQNQLDSSVNGNDPWSSPKGWDLESDTFDQKSLIMKKSRNRMLSSSTKLNRVLQLVTRLEKAGQTQTYICTQIVTQIIEKPELELIQWMLDYFDTLNEVTIVKLLEILFTVFDETQASDSISNLITSEVIRTQISDLLNQRFDNKLMIWNLKSIPFFTVKRILGCIMEKLEENCEIFAETEVIEQSFHWISALLDSHYPQFVFDGETELLASILLYIDQNAVLMEQLKGVEPALLTTLNKVSVTSSFKNSNYRRDMIYFE